MADRTWLAVHVAATAANLDTLCAKLTMNGATGLQIEDEADFRRFLAENRQYWDYVDSDLEHRMKGLCQVTFYITDDPDGYRQRDAWLAGIDAPYTTQPLQENDWATGWQKYYKPIPVGEKLYIVPDWERQAPVPAGRAPLYLNPGLTFGTGSHSSTQLCLGGVEQYTPQGGKVLDLGCGSGILSIAALVLGGGEAVGVDIDPKAVDVAYENAALNGIGQDRYTVLAGNVLDDPALAADLAAKGPYGLVLANIVADVIIPLAAQVRAYLAPGGVFLCSGVIDSRAAEVAEALARNGLKVMDRWEQKGWVAFSAR